MFMRVRSRLGPLAISMLLAVGVAACGKSSSRPSSARATSGSTIAPGQGAPSRGAPVAMVAGRPITRSSYEHWLAVEQALGASAGAGHRALGFLITSAWLQDEASARGVSVSEAQAKQRFAGLEHKSFPKAGALQAFLARSHESEADLLSRVRIELLQSRIADEVARGHTAAERASVLASFERAFQKRWKRRTTCQRAYVMEDCSDKSPTQPERKAPAGSAKGSGSQAPAGSPKSSGSSSSTPHKVSGGFEAPSSSPGQPDAGGEVKSPPGGMVITSPVVEGNGAIPAEYTCDGADLSLPLQWERVPAKAAALVLFAIDDGSSGPAGGIRWAVGDIDPHTTGVAAGATPEGGVVGSDAQGKRGYGGICPPRGKQDKIELQLYALRRKIPLSPGFAPQVAESEYAAGHDLLGPVAVTYATYRRP
jgi:phosphatidylethanolamine-binding protein (PEBP) family uncharacterized protein